MAENERQSYTFPAAIEPAETKIEEAESDRGDFLEYCHEAIGANPDNLVAAADDVVRALRTDAAVRDNFYEFHASDILRHFLSDLPGGPRSNRRVYIMPPPNPDKASEDGGLKIAADYNLLKFPIWGGKPLGEATRTEVVLASARFLKQGDRMTNTGKWLALVVRKMEDGNPDTKVGDVFTHEQLQRLQNGG
jgi:hypothetical protein